MIQAVGNARVPKFTIRVGRLLCAGNYGMCGRGFDPRFHLPLATRARVRDGRRETSAKVMDIVNRAKIERSGLAALNEEALKAMSDGLRQRLTKEIVGKVWHRPSGPGRRHLTDPRDTRRLLGGDGAGS
ncbi:MAG: hypothetical protein IPO19_04995 [Rhodoferax sp.]|nr:hypothetical protein [Rhodoferax sp.]